MTLLKRKPNKNQAMFIAAVFQTVAGGFFAKFGLPALGAIELGHASGSDFASLLAAVVLYVAATLAGYLLLD